MTDTNRLYEFLELSRYVEELPAAEQLELGLATIAAFEARHADDEPWAREEPAMLRIDLLLRAGESDQAAEHVERWPGADPEPRLWLRCRILEARGEHQGLVDAVEYAESRAVSARTLHLVADGLRETRGEPGPGLVKHMRRIAQMKQVERFNAQSSVAALDALLLGLSEASESLSTLAGQMGTVDTEADIEALVNQHTGGLRVGAARRQARSWLPVVAQLFEAIEARDLEAVERSLQSGARVDDEHADGMPLWSAAGQPDNRAIIVCLLGQGAKVDQRNEDGRTPLMRAVFRGHAENVEALVEAGAAVDPDTRGIADSKGDPRIVAALRRD